jgi:hypothetical protein
MYKPSTYLPSSSCLFFFPYLGTYIYERPIAYRIGYHGETKY